MSLILILLALCTFVGCGQEEPWKPGWIIDTCSGPHMFYNNIAAGPPATYWGDTTTSDLDSVVIDHSHFCYDHSKCPPDVWNGSLGIRMNSANMVLEGISLLPDTTGQDALKERIHDGTNTTWTVFHSPTRRGELFVIDTMQAGEEVWESIPAADTLPPIDWEMYRGHPEREPLTLELLDEYVEWCADSVMVWRVVDWSVEGMQMAAIKDSFMAERIEVPTLTGFAEWLKGRK